MNIIELKDVRKDYDGVTVVDGLSLSVGSGQIVALLGQTGAGKSTILNMIMGQIGPSSGTVRVTGRDPRGESDALRGILAVSFQTDRLLPWRTAEENVALGLEYLKVPKTELQRRARDWLNRVKLADIHHRKYPHQLSGGMRQRVSLARAMAIDPELILLDESFSQLDHTTSKILRDDFVTLVRSLRKTCLLITHRIDDAVEMADRIIVLAAPAKIKLEITIDRASADAAELSRVRERITQTLANSPESESAEDTQ